MEFTDYLSLKRGFRNKRINFWLDLRQHAFVVTGPYLSRGATPESIWSIEGDDERARQKRQQGIEISERTREFLKMAKANPKKNLVIQPSVVTTTNRGRGKRGAKGA